MTTINYEAEVDQDLTAIGKELEKNLYNSEAWAAKADILCSIRMHEIAIRCCDRSLAINPDNMLTWMTKASHSKRSESMKKQRL